MFRLSTRERAALRNLHTSNYSIKQTSQKNKRELWTGWKAIFLDFGIKRIVSIVWIPEGPIKNNYPMKIAPLINCNKYVS